MNHSMLIGLSKAEVEVAKLLAKGLSNQEIADRLFVTEKTIKFHLSTIYKKTDCKSRSEFIVKYKDDYEVYEQKENQMSESKNNLPYHQSTKQISQQDKVNFVHEKFGIGYTVGKLQNMMDEVTKQEVNASNVNAACNCVARLNETIDVAIKAARFLNER